MPDSVDREHQASSPAGWKSIDSDNVNDAAQNLTSKRSSVFTAVSNVGAFVTNSAESLGVAVHSFWSTADVPAIQLVMKSNAQHNVVKYDTLDLAIRTLAQLDEEDEAYIDQDSAETGFGLLRILRQFNVSPPKVFSHGGDSLVFKWDGDLSAKYITTASAMARLREYTEKNPGVVCASKFDLRSPDQVFNLITMLGGRQWKVAIPEND